MYVWLMLTARCILICLLLFFFFSSRRRHTRCSRDWSSDVCSSDLPVAGQVVDLAQYEAVAQTNGNTLPLFTGEGAVYGHAGNRATGFQPYDTFKCSEDRKSVV